MLPMFVMLAGATGDATPLSINAPRTDGPVSHCNASSHCSELAPAAFTENSVCLVRVTGGDCETQASDWGWFDTTKAAAPELVKCLKRAKFWRRSCGASATAFVAVFVSEKAPVERYACTQHGCCREAYCGGNGPPPDAARGASAYGHGEAREMPMLSCYLEHYPDLDKAFCNKSIPQSDPLRRCDWSQVLDHYVKFGRQEARKIKCESRGGGAAASLPEPKETLEVNAPLESLTDGKRPAFAVSPAATIVYGALVPDPSRGCLPRASIRHADVYLQARTSVSDRFVLQDTIELLNRMTEAFPSARYYAKVDCDATISDRKRLEAILMATDAGYWGSCDNTMLRFGPKVSRRQARGRRRKSTAPYAQGGFYVLSSRVIKRVIAQALTIANAPDDGFSLVEGNEDAMVGAACSQLGVPLTCSGGLVASFGNATARSLVVHPTYPKCKLREQGMDIREMDIVVTACSSSCDKLPIFRQVLAAGDLRLRRVYLYEKCGRARRCRVVLQQLLSTLAPGENVRTKTLPNVGRCDHTYAHFMSSQYDDLADAIFFVKDTWMLSKWSPALSPPSLASQLSVYGFACGGPLYLDNPDVISRYLPTKVYKAGSADNRLAGTQESFAVFKGGTTTWEDFQLQIKLEPHDETAMGELHVQVHSACDLVAKTKRGTSSPSVRIRFGDKEHQTEPAEQTLCAQYSESVAFRGIVSEMLQMPLNFAVQHDASDDDEPHQQDTSLGELSYSLETLRHRYSESTVAALTNVKSGMLNFSVSLLHAHPVCYGGVFTVQRHLVRSHPQSFYKQLASLLSRGDNIMEGHLAERTWARMFAQINRAWCPSQGDGGKHMVVGRCDACRYTPELDDFCPPHMRDNIRGCNKLVNKSMSVPAAKTPAVATVSEPAAPEPSDESQSDESQSD